MIKVRNLKKRFGGTTAINDVSFDVKRGEVLGFLGPNGAGKTTTMRILSGYMAQTSGSVEINGMDLLSHSLEIRKILGYLPENIALYPDMRVCEYLRFRASIKGVPAKTIKKRIAEVEEICSLSDVDRRIIGQLSRGFWQRIGLADSLLNSPELLILDEPTIGLDPNQIRNTRDMIKNLGGRYTIILSTHFLSEAEIICRRVLILNKGRIVASDAPENLMGVLKGNTHIVAEIFGPASLIASKLSDLDSVLRVACHECEGNPEEHTASWTRFVVECEKNSDARPAIHALASGNHWALRELRMEKRNLEDVFVEMTTVSSEGDVR